MEIKDRDRLASLLRRAASLAIPEAQFWVEFNDLTQRVNEPIMKISGEAATAYWEMFHRKKILHVISVSPTRAELRQGRDELNLIAAVLETGWQLPSLDEKYLGR